MRIRRSDEEVEIHRGANHVCVAAGGLRDAGSGCMPAARGQRSHVLHLEEEVRQPRCERAAPAQAVARRECTLEAPGGRSDPGSAHSAGGAQKKDLRPARRRQLALWIRWLIRGDTQDRWGKTLSAILERLDEVVTAIANLSIPRESQPAARPQ